MNKSAKFKGLLWALLLVTVIGLWMFISNYEPTPEYPLEFTQQQNVLREPPQFHLDESVDVEAIFTNKTEQDVTFTAAIHWILATQATEIIPTTDVVQLGLLVTLKPGCTELFFANKPPSEVIKVTKKLFEAGYSEVNWRLSGNNVIISPQRLRPARV